SLAHLVFNNVFLLTSPRYNASEFMTMKRLHNKYSSLHILSINDFASNKSCQNENLSDGQIDETPENSSQRPHRLHLLGFLGDLVTKPGTSVLGIRELLEWKDVIEIRQLSPGSKWPSEPISLTKYQPNTTLYLLTEFLQLQLDDGDVEPIFGSAFIYDVHSRLKLTETFHFDTNSSKLMNLFTGSMTNQQLAYRDASSLAQTCMFRISSRYNLFNTTGQNNSILKSHLKSPSYDGSVEKMAVNSSVSATDCESNRSDDYGLEDVLLFASEWAEKHAFSSSRTPCCKGGLFLVIRVEKVLQQGDVNDIIDGYNKDEKNKEKLKTTINWCCQRLGRYRMPLVWTAVDLTPYIIDIRNKYTQLQNDDINIIKTPESTNTNKQYVEPHKRNPGIGSSIRSRSVDPSIHNFRESHNGNLCDSLSSVGVSNNSPERSVQKVKYDWIKGIVTNYQEKRFHQSLSNSSKISEQLNSMDFLPIELKINNFFKQDQDRINDDELFRHINEIHRQTLYNYRLNSSGSGFNGIVVSNNNNNNNNSDNSSLNFSNISLSFTSAFSPTSGSVRRFKTISNVSLHLRLHLATPQTLVKLLKSVNLNIEKLLLNPEGLPYTGSMFQQFNDFSLNKFSSNSTTFSYIPNLIREVLELPSSDLMVPFTSYRNLLYVYPRSVSLPSSKQASSRNITVRVQLMYSDSTVTKVLPAIYGKSNSPRFISDSFTTVLYHNRSPEFFDEIKIQLPAKLEESHYLLFTFYHVICQTKKLESSTSLETVIGYSWLPLLEQGCLKDRAVNLLVSVDKPSPALAMIRPDIKSISEKFCMDACKWVDAHRELFNVSTTVVSSVYMQDALLECLLSACHVDRISCTIESFSSRSTVRCIIHTISIKMNNKSNNSNMETNCPCVIALELLIVFLNRITRNFPHLNDRHGRNQLLVSYLTGPHFMTIEAVLGHYFSGYPLFGVPVVSDLVNADQIDKGLLANIILTELVRIYLLRTKHIDSQNSQNFFQSLWFLLELFINLLAQDWHLTMETNEPTIILRLCENPCFLEDLSAFNSCLTDHIIRYGCSQEIEKSEDSSHWEAYRLWNQIFSFFLYDLLSLLPIGYVFSEIKNYWNKIEQLLSDAEVNKTLSDKLLKYFKLDLLQIICSHKAFYLLDIAANNDSLPVNCEQLLQRYQQVSLFRNDQTQSDKNSKYIPLATIEPEFYGTEDNQLHHSGDFYEKSFDMKSVNVSNNHFLISLVNCELITALKSENSDLQSRTVDLIWNILFNNEVDLEQEISEETSSPHSISNISQLTYFYSPILNITCDFLPCLVKAWHLNKSRLHQSNENESHKLKQQFPNTITADKLVPNQQNDTSLTGRGSGRMRRIRRYAKNTKFSESISDYNSFTKEPEKPNLPIFIEDSFIDTILNSQLDSTKPMKYTTLKRLLLIIIWIVKYMPTSLYYQWLQQASAKERSQLVLLIYLISDTFKIVLCDSDLLNKDDFPSIDTKSHLDYRINKNDLENGSDQNTSLMKLSNGHNSSFDRHQNKHHRNNLSN
ncbi:Dedicator of cytokinesis protein, partial [Schistosoma japonicum]